MSPFTRKADRVASFVMPFVWAAIGFYWLVSIKPWWLGAAFCVVQLGAAWLSWVANPYLKERKR